MTEDWRELAAAQHGLLSQRQLNELGVTRASVRSHLRARRWVRRRSSVLSVTTGPLSWQQQLWRAVLHAGPDALIGGLTAARVHGLRSWERPDITVLVANSLSFDEVPGVQFFRTRRPIDEMRARAPLPVCRVAPAVLLFAGYERNRRTAHGAVAAVVQQRLTGVEDLSAWLDRLRPLPGAKSLPALPRRRAPSLSSRASTTADGVAAPTASGRSLTDAPSCSRSTAPATTTSCRPRPTVHASGS